MVEIVAGLRFVGDLGLQHSRQRIVGMPVPGGRKLGTLYFSFKYILFVFVRYVVWRGVLIFFKPSLLCAVVHHTRIVVRGGAGEILPQLLLLLEELFVNGAIIAAEHMGVISLHDGLI